MKYFFIIITSLLAYSNLYSQYGIEKYSNYKNTTAEQFYENATNLKNSNKYVDAIANYKKALELYPDSLSENISLAYWAIQECYLNLKDYSQAFSACYDWIHKGGIYLGNAYYCLGNLWFNTGNFQNSIDDFSNAIQYMYDTRANTVFDLSKIYSYIKYNSQKMGNDYGWIPKSQFWLVNIPHANWEFATRGKICCINKFAFRIENRLPITIQAVNVDLVIKDKKGSIVYKKNHTAWVNNLNTNEVAQSDYFDLNNDVCLPCTYVDSDKLRLTYEITGVAF